MTDELGVDSTLPFEQSFIELAAGDGVRRVRTPEGSRFYGIAIGMPITADIIRAKKLEAKAQGKKAPKGGLTKKPKQIKSPAAKKLSPAANYGSNAPAKQGPPKPGAPQPGKNSPFQNKLPGSNPDTQADFQVQPPSIKGPQGFKVGDSSFSAPAGSKLIRSKTQEGVAYVVTPEGSVHVFNASGEIVQPEWLEPVLQKKFKDLKSDDTLYKIDQFDQPAGLADQKPGTVLSKNGAPAFKKQGNGTWMNEDIGVELTDDDLQRLYDAGQFDLEPANTIEDIDFAKMTKDELEAAMEAMPEGKQLKWANGVFTKSKTGWKSSLTGNEIDTPLFADLAHGQTNLTDKMDNPEAQPEVGKEAKAQKETEAKDPLRNPETELTPGNAQKKKAKDSKATGDEIRSAEDMATFYHDKLGPMTKVSENEWMTAESKVFDDDSVVASANSGFISKEPWDESQIAQKEQFDIDLGLAEPTAAEEAPEPEEGKSPSGYNMPPEVLENLKGGYKIQAIKNLKEANDGMMLATAKAEVEKIVEKTTQPDDELTWPMVYSLPTGAKFKAPNGNVFTRNSNGNWVSPEGGVASPEKMSMNIGSWEEEGLKAYVLENPGSSGEEDPWAPKEPERPEATAPEKPALPPGALTVTDASAVEVGMWVNISSELMERPIKLQKTGDNIWENEDGYPFTDDDVQVDADEGDVWMDAPEIDDTFEDGMEITDPAQLDQLQPGEKIAAIDPLTNADVIFTKQNDGTYVADELESDIHLEASDFTQPVENGEVTFYGKSVKKVAPKPAAKEETLDDKLAVGKITFKQYQEQKYDQVETIKLPSTSTVAGPPGFKNTKQVSEAIDMLESTDKFQVKYALKGLPADHPLKDDDFLASELDKAKKAFPNLAPKKALVKSLKVSINQDDELADWEKDLLEPDAGPKTNIGATTPKKTQTGMTGGTFSQKEIQDAIDILENYDGKVFKNALNQKGSPLGQLSPNDIVGFNKDKTVTKQKFIDLLKSKLDAPVEEPDEEKVQNSNYDVSMTPEAGKVVPANYEMDALDAVPDGTIVVRDATGNQEKGVYQKVGNQWLNLTLEGATPKTYNIMFYNTAMQGKLKWGTEADIPKAPPVGEDKWGNRIFSQKDLDILEPGTKIDEMSNSTGLYNETWTKLDTGEWTNGKGQNIGSNDLGGFAYSNIQAPQSNKLPTGQITATEAANLPPGTTIYFLDGSGRLTKKEDGDWETPEGGNISAGILLPTDKFSMEPILPDSPDFASMSNGAVSNLLYQYPAGKMLWLPATAKGEEHKFTKQDNGMWLQSLSGDNISGTTLANFKAILTDMPQLPPRDGQKVPNDTALKTAPDGQIVSVKKTVGDGFNQFKKTTEGWLDLDPESSSESYFETSEFKEQIEAGNVYFGKPAKGKGYIPVKLEDLPLFGVGSRMQVYDDKGVPTTVYTKKNDGWYREDGTSVNQSWVESLAGAGNLENIEDEPYVQKLYNGMQLSTVQQYTDMPNGSKVQFKSDSGNIKTYTKRGPDQWVNDNPGLADSNTPILDQGFAAATSLGKMSYYVPPVEDDDNQSDDESTLDAVATAVFESLQEYDKAVSILPPSERGANGDDFVVVITEDGPKPVWGKYGAGGIATIGMQDGVKKVLIGKRGDRDEWYLPGGAIDEKETHLQGALREFVEEVEDGESLLENMKIVGAHEGNIGKVADTDRDWKYVTSIADIGEVVDIKAPASSDNWELAEYKWFSADELADLEASGKLHGALSDGKLAAMVGFTSETDQLKAEVKSLLEAQNAPDNLGEVKYNIGNWKKVGGKAGFNEGGIYEDELGNKYYVKSNGAGTEGAHNEIVASALYKAAGVNSNEIAIGNDGFSDQIFLVSPWIENDAQALPNALNTLAGEEFVKKAQADFAIDAWLSNYDVIGNDTWNLVADSDGNALRIDPGGALMYRGTGGKKNWWSDNPTDIDDMRTGSNKSGSYSKAAMVFGDMTDEDVKESAKKLLNVTDKQIKNIVYASGLDEDVKADLYQKLVTRRQKILERFGLAETNTESGKAIKDVQDAAPAKQGFAPGTWVKAKGKGANADFQIEKSNNEVSIGTEDGKWVVYLNDELTTDINAPITSNYAFTANGQEFKKYEPVQVPDPDHPETLINANVVEASWSNGDVKVLNGTKVISVHKDKVLKAPVAAPTPEGTVNLGPDYALAPAGTTPLYKSNTTKNILVKDSDGKLSIFGSDGKIVPAVLPLEEYEANSNWVAITDSTPQAAPVDGPKDLAGNVVAVGDNVQIMKYNKGGLPNTVKIVSINTEKGTARVRRLDENGVPMSDENGKPVYANVALTSIQKNIAKLNDNGGLPTGITFSEGDPKHPLYGKPEPKAPELVKPSAETLGLASDWEERAEKAYALYRSKKGLSEKKMAQSSTAGAALKQAMQGDVVSLNNLKDKGYLDEDPKLFEELSAAIEVQKAKIDALTAQHEQNVLKYQAERTEWMKANGVASYTPLAHSEALQHTQSQAYSWAKSHFAPMWKKVKNSKGFSNQKGSSSWQTQIRLLPATLGLDREAIAAVTPDYNMQTWDDIQEGAEQAGPSGIAWRGVRSVSMDRFVKPDGTRMSSGDDMKQMIGSIQKDHGAMEFSPGSWDEGTHSGYDIYDVEVDLVIPPEIKGIYTQGTGLPNSSGSEHGFIAEPGLAMYIWDVFQDKNQPYKGPGGGRWVVKASLIPREVLPYMNNFAGDPMSHNIVLPGKDTTTGIPATLSTPSVSTPEADLPPFVSPEPGEWNVNDLLAAPVGTKAVDVNDLIWTKTESDYWVNEDGGSAPSKSVYDNFMMDMDSSITIDNVTLDKLLDADVGTIVQDSDGDKWEKINAQEWVGVDGLLQGQKALSGDVLHHMGG